MFGILNVPRQEIVCDGSDDAPSPLVFGTRKEAQLYIDQVLKPRSPFLLPWLAVALFRLGDDMPQAPRCALCGGILIGQAPTRRGFEDDAPYVVHARCESAIALRAADNLLRRYAV